ncbi:MAG TPA: FkbM family methyltransferase [Cyclobacteriaceae bacterium]
MKKVLFFHIYPINHWRDVTRHLIGDIPHDDIFVHISLPFDSSIDKEAIDLFLSSFQKIKHVFYSVNSPHPEVDAMDKFLEHVDLMQYSILTYMHSKGVTKPDSQNIKDWTELMRYFIVDKMSLCERVFKRGYLLYGVNKTRESNFEADFFYAGNFVSLNLTPDTRKKIKSTPIERNYHGLEGFWGKLCKTSYAYNAFYSRIDHYTNPFPDSFYKNNWRRIRYSATSLFYYNYYKVKYFIFKNMNLIKGIKLNLRRISNLYRATNFHEFLLIIVSNFIKRKFDSNQIQLHRLLIFSIACSDRDIKILKYTTDILLIDLEENGQRRKILVRKYNRDMIVFSEMFLEEGYLSHAKKMSERENIRFILDAGANIGCAALFLNVYFPNAQIICIEPETSNYEILLKNVQLNGLSAKIKCVNKAVWNTVTHLNLMQRDWSSDAFHVMDKVVADEVISTTETTTVLNLMNDFNVRQIDFLKMDIEGAEKTLFEDEGQLKEYLPHTSHIALEVHEEFISTANICKTLEKYGFNFEVAPLVGESTFVIANK